MSKNMKLLKSHFVLENTYELCAGDLFWLARDIEENSLSLIKGLLKRRFPKADLRRYNKQKLSDVAKNLIIKNPSIFSKSIQGTYYYDEFLQIPKNDYETIIIKFLDVVRGFSDSDIQKEKNDIAQDNKIYLKAIDKSIKTNNKLHKSALKQGLTYKPLKYSENIEKLKLLRETVEAAYIDANKCARLKCEFKVGILRRTNHIILSMKKEIEYDYLCLNHFLYKYNAQYVTFPLKHMQWLVVGKYRRLFEEWEKKQDKDDIVRQFEYAIQKGEFFESMFVLFNNNVPKISKERLPLLKEIKFLYQNDRFASCTLLTVTQLEGMLWDLGSYLTKKRKFVYKIDRSRAKIKYRPYEWNQSTGSYKNIKSTKYPDYNHNSLISARDLLKRTRLREFIPEPVLSYIIDDFYDERNELVHGNLRLLGKKETASYALLLLYSLLKCLEKIK